MVVLTVCKDNLQPISRRLTVFTERLLTCKTKTKLTCQIFSLLSTKKPQQGLMSLDLAGTSINVADRLSFAYLERNSVIYAELQTKLTIRCAKVFNCYCRLKPSPRVMTLDPTDKCSRSTNFFTYWERSCAKLLAKLHLPCIMLWTMFPAP